MFGMKSRTRQRFDKVERAAKRGAFESLRHAAFSISKRAKAKIIKSPGASAPGSAPATRGQGGKNLRGAIFTDVNPDSAVVGPRASFVGETGAVHEFGEKRGDEDFPERPFMYPTLVEAAPRFANEFAGSIGE